MNKDLTVDSLLVELPSGWRADKKFQVEGMDFVLARKNTHKDEVLSIMLVAFDDQETCLDSKDYSGANNDPFYSKEYFMIGVRLLPLIDSWDQNSPLSFAHKGSRCDVYSACYQERNYMVFICYDYESWIAIDDGPYQLERSVKEFLESVRLIDSR